MLLHTGKTHKQTQSMVYQCLVGGRAYVRNPRYQYIIIHNDIIEDISRTNCLFKSNLCDWLRNFNINSIKSTDLPAAS